jgi:hypothetical protein
LWIRRPDESDPKTHRRETSAAQRGWREWTIIDIRTFDQEKRIPSFFSQASELNPQPPSHQAAVEVKDTLPFNKRIGSDVVIADQKSLYAD